MIIAAVVNDSFMVDLIMDDDFKIYGNNYCTSFAMKPKFKRIKHK